jgi:hypothetical protein
VAREAADWSFLVLALEYDNRRPDIPCGALLVPETQILFIGVDRLLLACVLSGPALLWQDQADCGFWSWHRHVDTVLMAAELELAAWDIRGRKQWTTFVEPPWRYSVTDDTVHLEVLDVSCSFPLASGPDWGANLPWR